MLEIQRVELFAHQRQRRFTIAVNHSQLVRQVPVAVGHKAGAAVAQPGERHCPRRVSQRLEVAHDRVGKTRRDGALDTILEQDCQAGGKGGHRGRGRHEHQRRPGIRLALSQVAGVLSKITD
jgi:hypothetical protein